MQSTRVQPLLISLRQPMRRKPKPLTSHNWNEWNHRLIRGSYVSPITIFTEIVYEIQSDKLLRHRWVFWRNLFSHKTYSYLRIITVRRPSLERYPHEKMSFYSHSALLVNAEYIYTTEASETKAKETQIELQVFSVFTSLISR